MKVKLSKLSFALFVYIWTYIYNVNVEKTIPITYKSRSTVES